MRHLYCLLLESDLLSFGALSFYKLLQHAIVVAWLVSYKHLREPVALSCGSNTKIAAKCVNVLCTLLASSQFMGMI